MKKQRAFATLSEQEIDHIAELLRTQTYDEVLALVRKPRPEGFGLNISRKPLELLHAKTMTVDKINTRIHDGQKITLAEFDAINAGEKTDLSEEVHDAILETAYDLATTGENTPTQLLALQRLADFPARAEYREHRRQLELRKDQRDQEMHAHKRSMDEHRQHITNERLKLSERGLALREKELEWKQSRKGSAFIPAAVDGVPPDPSIPFDHLGYLAANLDEIEARATKKFNLPPVAPPSESAASIDAIPTDTSLEIQNPSSVAAPCENAANSTPSSPSEMEMVAEPLAEKLQATVPILACRRGPQFAEQTSPTGEQNGSGLGKPLDTGEGCSPAESKSSAVKNSSSPISVDSCPLVVKEHAIKRWRSFIPTDKTTTEPDESWRDECACGNPLPCADHPELWLRIRYYRPQNISYKEALEDVGIPYYIPTPEELGCSEETLKQSINPFTNNPQIKDAPSPYAIPSPSPGTPAPCRLPHLPYS